MMQYSAPEDWVLATGESHKVREFVEKAFLVVDLNWEKYVEISEKYFRPNEVDHLLGDASKAEKYLGWKPKTSFDELIEIMVKEDMKLAEKEKILMESNLLKPTWENPIG